MGQLAFAWATHLEAYPPVTEKTGERASVRWVIMTHASQTRHTACTSSTTSGIIYLLHLRAPGQLWMRFWMVGCEKPKKSAPDGTTGATGLELKREECC